MALTKSSKLTLLYTERLPMQIWKFGPLFIKSLVIRPKLTSFFLFALFRTLINITFRVSVIC